LVISLTKALACWTSRTQAPSPKKRAWRCML